MIQERKEKQWGQRRQGQQMVGKVSGMEGVSTANKAPACLRVGVGQALVLSRLGLLEGKEGTASLEREEGGGPWGLCHRDCVMGTVSWGECRCDAMQGWVSGSCGEAEDEGRGHVFKIAHGRLALPHTYTS